MLIFPCWTASKIQFTLIGFYFIYNRYKIAFFRLLYYVRVGITRPVSFDKKLSFSNNVYWKIWYFFTQCQKLFGNKTVRCLYLARKTLWIFCMRKIYEHRIDTRFLMKMGRIERIIIITIASGKSMIRIPR